MRNSDSIYRGQTSQQKQHRSQPNPTPPKPPTPPTQKNTSIYGPNYRKAKRFAMARSDGTCQLCGLRKAEEGHHWTWPDYPSDDEIQGHHITALCKPCHDFATVLRDWVTKHGADLDQLERELKRANNFFAKRGTFSYWLLPKTKKETNVTTHTSRTTKQDPGPAKSAPSSPQDTTQTPTSPQPAPAPAQSALSNPQGTTQTPTPLQPAPAPAQSALSNPQNTTQTTAPVKREPPKSKPETHTPKKKQSSSSCLSVLVAIPTLLGLIAVASAFLAP